MVFDVTKESWLPVRTLNGEFIELNLLDFLERSQELEDLEGLNTMEEYSIYRFFATFLMAALKPKRWDKKLEFFEKGHFDMKKIYDYIQLCKEEGVSFDIFDKERPFLQSPYNKKYDSECNRGKISYLDYTKPHGNNHIHFDDTLESEIRMTPAQAFRGLITTQIFCTVSTGGYPSTIYGAPKIFYLPKGENLFQRLVLSIPCMALDEENMEKEFWRERKEIIPNLKVKKPSKLFGMFFPARRVLLIEENGIVTDVYYQPGLAVDKNCLKWKDPHITYSINNKKQVAISPTIDIEGWKNIGTIATQFSEKNCLAPEVIQDYAKILNELGLTKMDILSFNVLTKNAKYISMHRNMISLDVRIVKDTEKSVFIEQSIDFAKDVSKILKFYLNKLIAQEKKKLPGEKQKPGRGEKEVQRKIYAYFSECEKMFYKLEREVSKCEDNTILPDKMINWQDMLIKMSRTIFERMQILYCSSGKDLSRGENAYNKFIIALRKLKEGKKK